MSSTSNHQASAPKPIHFGPFDVTNQVFLTTHHSFALVNLKPLLPGHVLVCPLRPHLRLTDLSPPELTDLFQAVQRVQRMLARHYFLPAPHPSGASSGAASGSGARSDPDSTSAPPPLQAAQPEEGSFNIALQDGPEAGQTVAHVHVHIIPRIRGATAKPADTPSDAIYEQMANEDGNVGGAQWDAATAASRTQGGSARQEEEDDRPGPRPRPGGSFPRIEDAGRQARSMAEMEEEAAVYRGVLETMSREEESCRGRGG